MSLKSFCFLTARCVDNVLILWQEIRCDRSWRLNWFNKLKETIMSIYLPADFSAKTTCVTHLRNIAHIFPILACKTCYEYNQGHGKRKPLLSVSLRFFFFFFGLKDLFPWWWYSVLSIGINISGEDLGGVIVLSAIFVTPRMQNSPGWKSGYYSRHAKFNHLGSEEVMLKHRKKARESNLVLPNSNQEVLIVVMFYNCWMIRDKQ